MNLTQRIQAVTGQVRELRGLRERAGQAALMERRADELGTPAAHLSGLNPAVLVLLGCGLRVALEAQTVKVVRERITDLRSRYLADRNVMLDPFPNEDIRYVLYRALNSLPAKAESALLDSWGLWASGQFPCIDTDVLNLLGNIKALSDGVAQVQQLKEEAETLCSCLPLGDEDVMKVKDLAVRIGDAWQNLAGDGVPPDILGFLRKAITPLGAALHDMTPHVLEWMSDHGLSSSLRVRIG